MDEYERERNTGKCLDSEGVQRCPSSSEGMEALIKQILDGNNRIETKVDGLGTRVTAVERKTNDLSKRMDSTSEHSPQAGYTPVACIAGAGGFRLHYDDGGCLQQGSGSP